MDIDVVDIGGASRVGVPKIPEPRDADGENEDEAELLTLPVKKKEPEVPDAVKKAVAPGAVVAYPDEHPAVSSDLPVDAEGRFVVGKGKALTKSLLEQSRDPKSREVLNKELDTLLAEEKTTPEGGVARSSTGLPLIEVMFQTEIGAIVSYFHKVVHQSQWLVLVSDNTAPAQAKFIPTPRENPDGSMITFDLVITGSDKKTSRLRAIPLGVQFTVDNYDFIVMMVEE